MNKDLEDYEFKILKMEKRSVLIQNYNISQLNTSNMEKKELTKNPTIQKTEFSKEKGTEKRISSQTTDHYIDTYFLLYLVIKESKFILKFSSFIQSVY